jgi:EmrB/QacA subfamily drug resistance transporter
VSLAVLCIGTFAILLDTTIVNVALPSVITGLHASLDRAVWIVNGYLLAFAALLILAGRLGDMFGPRRLFVIGLVLFAGSSALCGAAQSADQLIGFRILQGIGGAALAPQGFVLIQSIFPRERMGAAFGIFSSMVGLAAVSGPTLGGVLTTYLSWRWVFYVNVPIAIAGIALTYRFVPEIRAHHRRRVDLVGVILATTGLSALVYGLIEGQRYSWGTVTAGITIPEILTAAAILLAAFVLWERRQPDPLVPLGLFRNRTFAILVVLNLFVQFALQSMLFINSINLQSVLHMSAVHSGLTGLPLTVALTALAPFAGRLTDRFGGKYVLMVGLLVYAGGIAGVIAVSSTDATSWTFAPVLLVAGIGMGAIFAPLATMAMRAVAPQRAGAASGLLNTGRQLGATLGTAITGAVLANRLAAAMRDRAIVDAAHLPVRARVPFVAGFDHPAALQVGSGQAVAKVPANTPSGLAPEIHRLISDVFGHGYISAMVPTLGVSVGVLVAGALGCLLLSTREPHVVSPATSEPHAVGIER